MNFDTKVNDAYKEFVKTNKPTQPAMIGVQFIDTAID